MSLKGVFDTPKKCIGWAALLIVIIMAYVVTFDRITPNTSDGYVNAHVIEVASSISGEITEVYVKDNMFVRKGDSLFQIDPYIYEMESLGRRALLLEIEEDIKARKEQGPFLDGKDVRYIQAETAYNRANYKLKHTTVCASKDGYVTNLTIQPGFFAKRGVTQLALVDTESWWVVSYFKENNLSRICPGQRALVTLDMYPGKVFKAEVLSVGYGVNPEVTPPSRYLPHIEQTNNWVQLAQRFPVKLSIIESLDDYSLRVGATADVTIFTTDSCLCNGLATFFHWMRAQLLYAY